MKVGVKFIVFCAIGLVAVDAHAGRFGVFGNRNNSNNYNYTRPAPQVVHTAPAPQIAPAAERPEGVSAGVSFIDYDSMSAEEKDNSLHWKIQSPVTTGLKGKEVFVSIDYVKTRNSGVLLHGNFPAKVDERGNLEFDLTGLDAASVYRLDKIKVFTDNPSDKPVGTIAAGLYGVTHGGNAEAKARRGVVMKALKEAFAWDHPQAVTPRKGEYGAYGADWCWKFYQFCARSHSRSDGNYIAYISSQPSRVGGGQALKNLAARGPVHGNLLKGLVGGSSNHVGMILDVDPDTGYMVTIEGNVNSRVEIKHRTVNSYSNIGNIDATTIQ